MGTWLSFTNGNQNRRSGSLRLFEAITLVTSVALAAGLAASAHRWALAQMELTRYRTTVQDLTSTVRAIRALAAAQRTTIELRIDAARGIFQLASVHGTSTRYETVSRTIWLPGGLMISDAPAAVTALPTGRLSTSAIVIAAPAYNRLFRLTTHETGLVQLDEESTL